jgi:hypothetical protein
MSDTTFQIKTLNINAFQGRLFVGVTIVNVNLDWTLFVKSRIDQDRLNSP